MEKERERLRKKMEKTILVVEDDRGLNQGVAMALKNSQYHFCWLIH